MSPYQVGTRVVVSFGFKRGCAGVIENVRSENGVEVVDVMLDGQQQSQPFRPSVLMREMSRN